MGHPSAPVGQRSVDNCKTGKSTILRRIGLRSYGAGRTGVKDTMFWTATILYVFAIVFAYFNRASEKVVTTLFLGLAALVGSVLAVVLFSSDAPIKKAFSVPIIIHADTRLPVEGFPYPVLPMDFAIRVREKLMAHPELLPDATADSFARNMYHHALQRAMLYWLERKYPTTWQVDEFPLTVGEGSGYSSQARQVPSRVYRPGELKERMSGNVFADVDPFGDDGLKFGLALPTGTDIQVTAPHFDTALGEISGIRLRNRFCTIVIESRFGMSMVGAGSYRILTGMSQLQAQQAMKLNQYVVLFSATFNPLLTGNPEMPSYRKWVTDIADGLQIQFSDQVVWQKTREWLLLHRVVGS